MSSEPRVAFLGLGAIGRPMAARLSARFPLTVWNRSRDRVADFVAGLSARFASSAADAVQDAQVVMTCFSTSADVEEVLFGSADVAQALRKGTLFLDCTSGDPATSQRLSTQLRDRGVDFADCPVSGGTNGAAAGTLTVMVGAEPGVFDRARPYLEAFGKLIVNVGPVGAGDTVKAINQVLLATNILSLGEALTAMVKSGVHPRRGLDVLNASSGRSFVSEALIPERVLTGAWPNTFRLALLDKDVRIALDLISELGVQAPVLEQVRSAMGAARAALGEQADYLEAIKLNEAQADVEIRG